MSDAAAVQNLWRAYKKNKCITVNSIGGQTAYSAEYKRWQQLEHKTTFDKWTWFDHAKSLLNDLEAFGVYKSFVEFCQEHVDFVEPQMNPWLTLAVCKEMIVVLKPYEKVCAAVSPNFFNVVVIEALKFCIPLASDDDANDGDASNGPVVILDPNLVGYSWQFKAPSQETTRKINWLVFDLKDSVTVRKGLLEKARAEAKTLKDADKAADAAAAAKNTGANCGEEGEGQPAEQLAKRARRCAGVDAALEDFTTEILVNGKATSRNLILDMILGVKHEYSQMHQASIDTTIQDRVLQMAVRQTYQFTWTKELKTKAKLFNKWYDLRKEVKACIRRAHEMLGGSNNQKLDPDALAQHLLDLVNTGSGTSAEPESFEKAEVMDALNAVGGALDAFLQMNSPEVPIKIHPFVSATVSKCLQALQAKAVALNSVMTLQGFLTCVAEPLCMELKTEWVQRTLGMLDAIDSFDELWSLKVEARRWVGDAPRVERLLQMRSKYVVEVCIVLWDMYKEFAEPPRRVRFDDDLKDVGSMLSRPGCQSFLRSETTIAEVTKIDALITSPEGFAKTWTDLLKALVSASPAVTAAGGKLSLQASLVDFKKRAACRLLAGSSSESVDSIVAHTNRTDEPVSTLTTAAEPSKLPTSFPFWDMLTYISMTTDGDPLHGTNVADDLKQAGATMSTVFLKTLVAHVESRVQEIRYEDFKANEKAFKILEFDIGEKLAAVKARTALPAGFRFVLAGSVSMIKADKNCFHMGDIFGIPLFIHGHAGVSHESFSPGWAVRKAGKKETANMTADKMSFDVFMKDGFFVADKNEHDFRHRSCKAIANK